MEQSQTPGDLVHHPDYDAKKTLVDLKEKLTLEGLDDSEILVKLMEAHDAIQHACEACMVTHEDDIQEFWDDHTFSRFYHFWLDNVKFTMLNKGSSDFEISDAVKKAKRTILAAKEACTTDTERAELLRIKNLEDEENYEDLIYGKIDADPDWVSKDKAAALEEHLIGVDADKPEILTRLNEAEAAIQRVSSICGFNDKEKQIFRCDINGKYSADLLFLMSCRLKKLGDDEDTVEEMVTMAYDAILDANFFFETCMTSHQAEDEKDGGGSSKRPRID